MTARILFIVGLAFGAATTRGVDINKIPPMNETKMSPDVELKGREVEAIEVALRQAREDRISKSGDFKHFTIELRREGSTLFVWLLPEYDQRSGRSMPGSNKYGTYISYAVSLRTLKLVGWHLWRD